MNDIIKPSTSTLTQLGTPSSPSVVPFSSEIFLLSTTVAGTTHCENIEEISEKLLPLTTLSTKRKPYNEHDNLAIAILYGDTQIGWIPQDDNEVISRLMDSGKIIICKVKNAEWKGKWFKVKVDVFMVD